MQLWFCERNKLSSVSATSSLLGTFNALMNTIVTLVRDAVTEKFTAGRVLAGHFCRILRGALYNSKIKQHSRKRQATSRAINYVTALSACLEEKLDHDVVCNVCAAALCTAFSCPSRCVPAANCSAIATAWCCYPCAMQRAAVLRTRNEWGLQVALSETQTQCQIASI
eukprot:10908-Heterococcus_DN1.PRE.2